MGTSAYAVQGTVASDTTPYYVPANGGVTNNLTVRDLTVTNNATVNNITVNDTIAVINNLFTPIISYYGDITIKATDDGGGGLILSAPADTCTSVFRRFGLFDCLGSRTSPVTISATPLNMPTSKGFFEGSPGDSGDYVFTFNPGYNPNPFAIIQSIDGTATNVQYWEITGPGQLTVHGPGGASVARFSMIIL
jgi:hypothetical protein